MEDNNWRPVQGEPPSSDWRSQMNPKTRQTIVNKIMDVLKRHLPVAFPGGMAELNKIAAQFEEKIYTTAVDRPDYLRKISLKMLSVEAKTKQNTPMSPQTGVSQNSTDSGSLGITPQVNKQGQSLPQIPMVGQTLGRQHLLAQNLQDNSSASLQGSSSLSASPSIAEFSQSALPNFNHTSNMQNMPGISHNSLTNSLAHGTTTDIYANAQRQIQGRQKPQQSIPAQQQQQSKNSLPYQNQPPPSQQSVMPMPYGLPSGQSSIQQPPATTNLSAPQSTRQQNQQNSIQQPATYLLPQPVQTISRQSQEPLSSFHQQTSLQQQSAAVHQQSSLQIQQQQQQQLMGRQQLLNQQMFSLHPRQFGQQTNMEGLQQQQQNQLLGSRLNIPKQSLQSSIQLLQQSKNMSQTQQQLPQPSMPLLQPQGRQSHNLSSQQQLISQFQSKPGQLQLPLAMQQQPNAVRREMHQRLQASGALLHSQKAMEQQKQFMLSQSGIPEVSYSTSMDSTSQTEHHGVDWQEEVYQKLQALKEAHFSELQEFHMKISLRFQQIETIPLAKRSEILEKLKSLKVFLEHLIALLQISKNGITIILKEKLPLYEKQIFNLLNSNIRQKVMPTQQEGQQPGGHAQTTPHHRPSQALQVQPHENHGNQVHQSAASSSIQHGSMTPPSFTAPSTQQNESNSVQSVSNFDPVEVNSFGSLQQGSTSSAQKSGAGPLQNSVSLYNSSQCSNASSMQNSNLLPQQLLKQKRQDFFMKTHPMNELNELKARQGSSIEPETCQRHNYYHLKPCSTFPTSSPQNLQASSSPQISHHSSPQLEQHALSPTLTKAGTPVQSTGSPFVVPSPSTSVALSPMPGVSEQLVSASVALPTAGETNHKPAASRPPQAESPGISASPLLAKFINQESNLPHATATSKASASDRPVELLIKAVQSLTPKALSSAVSDISSVVSMIDQFAGSAPGSRSAIGEDLASMARYRLQSRNLASQDGGAAMNNLKRHGSAMPLNNASSAGSEIDDFIFRCLDSFELESTATSRVKRQKLEVKRALNEEIREINQQLIDTAVSISDEDSDSVAASSNGGGEGTVVKCSFNAVSVDPSLKAHLASMQMSPTAALTLLVPSSYPKSSPLLLDKLPIEPSKELEDLSMKAKSRFSISLRVLSQPTSLREMARTWDGCVRKVILEYAQQAGGGTFSSIYGAWENCVAA